VLGDHGFDDGEDLLLLISGKSGDGFGLRFELGFGAALSALRAVANAQQILEGNSESFR
jgi:hypothetical protein